jgi:uncharacterized repeat protein (TIGR01451 family)
VVVTNLGPDDAVGVSLNDNVPGGMTFVSESQNNGPAFNCTNPPVGSGGTITCTIATLTAGSSADFTFVMHISPATPPGTTFTNIANVSSSNDPNVENNSSAASVTTPGVQQADLAVAKNAPAFARANSDVPFGIVLTNSGPGAAQNVALSDPLPGNMTFVSMVQNSGPSLSCATPAVGAGGTVTCTTALMPNGTSASFTLTAHIPTGTPSGTTYQNSATVTSNNDPTAENNVGIATVQVPSSDLGVVKSGPGTGTAGSTITWTITASNAGPDTTPDANLADTLPSGTTFVSLTQNNGPAATCSVPPVGASGSVSCTFPAFNSGDSAQFTLVAKVNANVTNGAVISNTATIASGNVDPNNSNNSSTATTTIATSADLSVTKVGAPNPVTAGTNLTYTITVNNAGPSDAANVSVADITPTGLTFVSNSGGCTNAFPCNLGTLTPGQSVTITSTYTVTPGYSGTSVTNTASVSSTTSDPNPGNNSGTVATNVVTSSDLSVTKSGTPNPVTAGTNLTYTITVKDTGPSNAATVSLSDPLPPATTFVSLASPGGWSCTTPAVGAGGTVSCTIASFAPGNAVFTLIVRVPANVSAGTTITNTATVSSPTADPTTSDQSATVTATVVAPTITATAGTPQGTVILTPFGTALRANVKDTNNANIPNVPVTFTVQPSAGGAGATFVGGTTCGGKSCVTVQTDASGNATAPTLVANGQAGNYTVTAAVSPATQATYFLKNMISPTATNGVITGRILTADGSPVPGTVITLSGTQSRKTITDPSGNYHFDNVDTTGLYTVTPSRVNYNFSPFNRSFSQLGSNTEAAFTGSSTGDSANPLDTPEYFVRQQYVDVLGREPDEGGFNYWSDRMLSCGDDASCLNARRRDVAAAFFIEQEFQQSGSFIYDVYAGAFGRRPLFTEYASDRRQVVGGAALESEKAAFAKSFVQRAEFLEKYQANTTAESFVGALLRTLRQSYGVDLSSQYEALVTVYNGGGNLTESRAASLRAITDNGTFKQASYNSAFVLTEYFAYLQRDPDRVGYEFWLNALNTGDAGNYRFMVCSFITSTEYQRRFGAVVSHGNGECGP